MLHHGFPPNKRKRTYGTFCCDYDGCGRSFTPCTWPGCELVFSRNDVREKHIQRHAARVKKADGSAGDDDDDDDDDHPEYSKENAPLAGTGASSTYHENVLVSPESMTPLTKPLSPSDLIEWLFHDDSLARGDKLVSSEFHNFPNEVSPVSSLIENVFAITPQFPHSSTRDLVDDSVRLELISHIPSLGLNQDFGLPHIERCLEIYWSTFHPQYPILHRPSFSNSEAHPLLLLSMIMVGASLVPCSGHKESLFVAPQKLAEHIAEPLRWLIFSNADCKPPAKLYVVQSLLLLESFEITSTSRFLHERSFLYHGTKIQLLRRSPILGGDPLKQNVEDQDPQVWKQWIEFESMKRACLMAFHLDTVNSTVYGHTLILYAYQIKLSLPCEDSLWEYDNEYTKIDSISKFQSPKFLDALKGLLHRKHIQTSTFGKSILLAGLLTIMFQMQQKDLQLSFLEWDSMKESWNEIISIAIDVWRVEMCPNGCFDTKTALHFTERDYPNIPPMLKYEDTRCKFSLYHIAQIYMRITHYDYIVYAGAPSRMNVTVTETEYQNVERRVKEWSHSTNGDITVVHAYLFLFEMLLSPHNEDISYLYDPNTDPFLHRKNIMASAILVIFAYNFSKYGNESNFFGSLDGDSFYPDREDGYSYLRRIRKNFISCISGPLHQINREDSLEYHKEIKAFAAQMKNIENTHHIAGLLKIFHKGFTNSNWEVGREYSRLFKNCIERCLGRESITCVNMYE
ncbi:C2H2 zinc finger protein Ribonuc_L-PSP Endoribonuclease L-PSP [Suhomyces tanzawaensis NRRL Y-17324]|uniref:C2H2 zinc finger protein Ribonuc_L-PSP Endoribonuclease L-PSP n=1 Tax=Suhomyces tanzawaensis NRRL Y-17324 TaxID=984487 RepID=A0A1E4SE84_9ASCO|nr:C2H2 zinc finger protein Ribonuc_L-PSP Endoribonuclease L-PSP [Suhomyces tanzawaensis NRRL Y-17324]ODV77776.1 C2H2 zinc finger protein Ribonuc_L-PSP Endoribonuclease L-PSP [Suhomyces tanzawaensis NRRL Y-17324]